TGSLALPRVIPEAVLLTDGRVLVVGGGAVDGTDNATTAEIFDPSTGVWYTAGTFDAPRYGATASRLRDGRVLLAGGSNGTDALASALLFDPSSGKWSVTGSLHRPRHDHIAAVNLDGRAMVIGGYDADGNELRTAEI